MFVSPPAPDRPHRCAGPEAWPCRDRVSSLTGKPAYLDQRTWDGSCAVGTVDTPTTVLLNMSGMGETMAGRFPQTPPVAQFAPSPGAGSNGRPGVPATKPTDPEAIVRLEPGNVYSTSRRVRFVGAGSTLGAHMALPFQSADRTASPGKGKTLNFFKKLSGAGEGTRTPDPIITNDVLYQLSYTGLSRTSVKRSGPFQAAAAAETCGSLHPTAVRFKRKTRRIAVCWAARPEPHAAAFDLCRLLSSSETVSASSASSGMFCAAAISVGRSDSDCSAGSSGAPIRSGSIAA